MSGSVNQVCRAGYARNGEELCYCGFGSCRKSAQVKSSGFVSVDPAIIQAFEDLHDKNGAPWFCSQTCLGMFKYESNIKGAMPTWLYEQTLEGYMTKKEKRVNELRKQKQAAIANAQAQPQAEPKRPAKQVRSDMQRLTKLSDDIATHAAKKEHAKTPLNTPESSQPTSPRLEEAA